MAKKHWMKIHTYLSLFFLPMCLIYVLTGIGYIAGFKDSAGAKIHKITLESTPQNGKEREFILELLKNNNLKIPKNTAITMMRDNPTMGNIKYNVALQKDKNGQMSLVATERSIYGVLVLMHKAKGAVYFNALAICFAVSLMIFYLSGLIVTSFCKKNRKPALITLISGLALTAIAIFLSL